MLLVAGASSRTFSVTASHRRTTCSDSRLRGCGCREKRRRCSDCGRERRARRFECTMSRFVEIDLVGDIPAINRIAALKHGDEMRPVWRKQAPGGLRGKCRVGATAPHHQPKAASTLARHQYPAVGRQCDGGPLAHRRLFRVVRSPVSEFRSFTLPLRSPGQLS